MSLHTKGTNDGAINTGMLDSAYTKYLIFISFTSNAFNPSNVRVNTSNTIAEITNELAERKPSVVIFSIEAFQLIQKSNNTVKPATAPAKNRKECLGGLIEATSLLTKSITQAQ